jgi:hypothetical protein
MVWEEVFWFLWSSIFRLSFGLLVTIFFWELWTNGTSGTYWIEFGYWVPLLFFGASTPVLAFTYIAQVLS